MKLLIETEPNETQFLIGILKPIIIAIAVLLVIGGILFFSKDVSYKKETKEEIQFKSD